MGEDWILYIAVWLASASGAYVIARAKGDPELARWAVMGVVFGPLGVLLAVFLARPEKPTPPTVPAPVATGPVASAALCPQCGAKRLGSYRYCTTCKFDYDVGVAAPEPVPTEAGKSTSPWRAVLLVVGILAAVFIGMQVLAKAVPTVPTFAADLPPVGSIWFGSSFDPDTFAIRGQLTSTTVNSTVAVVAHLGSAVDGSRLNVRMSVDGAVMSNAGFNSSGSGNVWGWTAGPLFAPGAWRIELTDIGGNVLASGALTVTE